MQALPLAPAALTISQLVALHADHAKTYYRRKDGSHTGEHRNFTRPFATLCEQAGSLSAADFDRRHLRAYITSLIALDHSRSYINACHARIIRLLRWATELEHIPPAVLVELSTVRTLPAHRSKARESPPRTAVPFAHVEKVLPHLPRLLQDVVRLLQLTGARPSELLCLTTANLNRDDDTTWYAFPPRHKSEHHGRHRVIPLDARCQDILLRHLRPFAPDLPLFQSRRDFTKPLAANTLYQAVRLACKKAGVPKWSPYQIRHAVATIVRRKAGLDAAQALLGHAKADTTEIYAHLDASRAAAAQEALHS